MGIHSRSLKLVAQLFARSHEEQAETATGSRGPIVKSAMDLITKRRASQVRGF